MRKIPLAIFAAAALSSAANAQTTDFKFGGFVKLDVMASKYNDGTKYNGSEAYSVLSDYYAPQGIPTGGEASDLTWDIHAKTSRFNLSSTTKLDNGKTIKAFYEVDFLTGGGNERVSNSYSPRMRHAFVSYDNVLAGQTWSTFMNTSALPEVVDFVGPTEGIVFVRQGQIRYTAGDFQFSVENPETQVAYETSETSVAKTQTDAASIPDFVARYNFKAGDHSFAVSALARQLKYEDAANDISEDTMGFGFNFSGKMKFGMDDLTFSYTYGAVGRYVGTNLAPDAYMDVNGDIEAIDTTSAFVGYRHFWTDTVRSSFVYSYWSADTDEYALMSSYLKETSSVRANVMWSPEKNFTYGVELSHAEVEKAGGAEGSMDRLQFTAKYAF